MDGAIDSEVKTKEKLIGLVIMILIEMAIMLLLVEMEEQYIIMMKLSGFCEKGKVP